MLGQVAHSFALLGGLIMLSLAIITVTSIIGRTFFGSSIEGDFEITEIGLAIAIFLFLPECYLRQGHVVVDLFTSHCKPGTLNFLDRVSDLIFTLVSAVFAYRMSLSGLESYDYIEQTMMLELQVWWVYAVGVVSMAFCAICGLVTLFTKNQGDQHE